MRVGGKSAVDLVVAYPLSRPAQGQLIFTGAQCSSCLWIGTPRKGTPSRSFTTELKAADGARRTDSLIL